MMEGFLEFILGDSSEAKEMRRQSIIKVIPMINPDGVIAGNYRVSCAGNDLNRMYMNPDERLHPTVNSLKQLISDITKKEKSQVLAFVDMHGHSRKKNSFIYGPYQPLHS